LSIRRRRGRIKIWKKIKKGNQTGKTIGTILVDLGKLSFGSLLLGSVLRGGFDPLQTFIMGAVLAIILFVIGIILITRSKE
jgi:hypothetical protein